VHKKNKVGDMELDYELIPGSRNDVTNIEFTILKNRGIENPKEYLSLKSDCLIPYQDLENIDVAVSCLLGHLDDEIHVVVDCDVDGYTSAAMLISYLKDQKKDINITYHLHSGKQHGLQSDIEIPKSARLVIVPDAGTNDIEPCKALNKAGIDVIILDHHIAETENPYAIVVNNQTCGYTNKEFSGAGITYKFLQAIDEELWTSFADKYIDLAAIGNIADVMDMRSYETKYIADKGIALISNPLIKQLCEQNSFKIKSDPTIHDIQFYIVPAINAVIRAGNSAEKELMFRALLGEYEPFKYKKRGEKEATEESICERVVRLATNIRNRQSKACKQGQDAIRDFIERYNQRGNKILFVNVTGLLDEAYTGLTATRIAEEYTRPCLLLRKRNEDETLYGGSGRNINNGSIDNLKSFLESTGCFESIMGHENAFGVEIKKENIPKAIQLCNERLKDSPISKSYKCDFIIGNQDLTFPLVKKIDGMSRCWGQMVEEPYIAVEGVHLDKKQVSLIGKQSNTLKWKDEETGVEFVKFSCNETDPIYQALNEPYDSTASFDINIVGRASINVYKSMATPQFIIIEYEVL